MKPETGFISFLQLLRFGGTYRYVVCVEKRLRRQKLCMQECILHASTPRGTAARHALLQLSCHHPKFHGYIYVVISFTSQALLDYKKGGPRPMSECITFESCKSPLQSLGRLPTSSRHGRLGRNDVCTSNSFDYPGYHCYHAAFVRKTYQKNCTFMG